MIEGKMFHITHLQKMFIALSLLFPCMLHTVKVIKLQHLLYFDEIMILFNPMLFRVQIFQQILTCT